MCMATQHQARLDHIQNGTNRRHAVIWLTSVAQPGRTAVHEEHVDVAQGQTLFYLSAPKICQALQGSLGLWGQVIIEVVKGPIESRNADVLSPLGQRQHRAGFQMTQVAQWALT